jgi:tetratricopeptide (TPR) repeat protein
MSVQSFFGFLVQVGLLIGLFTAGPFLLFFLATTYADSLGVRGKYHKAYRFSRAVYYFTDIPLLRLWVGKFHYLQLRQLSELAGKIGDRGGALDWLRLAAEPHFAPSERINALAALATLLRKQNRRQEAEAAEEEALAIVPAENGPKRTGQKITEEPSDIEAAQAGVLIRQGRFTEALARLDHALKSSDKHAYLAEAGQVAALRQLGRYDESIAIHEASGRKHYERMERILTQPSQDSKILDSLRGALAQVQTSNLLTHISLLLEAGKPDAARECWNRLPATMDDATRATRHAVGAWLCATQGDADGAKAQIRKAEATLNRHEDTRQAVTFTLARAEFTLREYASAAERLEALVRDTGHLPLAQAEYRTLLASTHAKMGRTDAAHAEYGRVIAAGFEEAVFTRTARAELAGLADSKPDSSETV